MAVSHPDRYLQPELYTTLARTDPQLAIRRATHDLASVTREASANRTEIALAITPYTWQIDRTSKKVTCPEFDPNSDISTHCRRNTPRDRVESAAVGKMRDAALERTTSTLFVWLSPREPDLDYQGNRAVIGYFTDLDHIQHFGLCLPPEVDMLRVANNFDEYAGDHHPPFKLPVDIRSHPFILDIPADMSAIPFLQSAVPDLETYWQALSTAQAAYDQTLEKMLPIAREMVGELSKRPQTNRVKLGAEVEWSIRSSGYALADRSECGISNLLLLGLINGQQGEGRGIGSWMLGRNEKKKKIFNCGACKKPLRDKHGHQGLMMKKGDKCPHCRGIYLGC